MFDLLFLSLSSLAVGVCITLMKLRKNEPFTGTLNIEKLVDEDALAEKIAKALSKELKIILQDLYNSNPRSYSSSYKDKKETISDFSDMDKVIPVSLKAEKIESNLTNMSKSEKSKDKKLSESKSKLKDILKKNK